MLGFWNKNFLLFSYSSYLAQSSYLVRNSNLVPRADFVLFRSRFDFTEQQVQPGRKRCLMPWVRGCRNSTPGLTFIVACRSFCGTQLLQPRFHGISNTIMADRSGDAEDDQRTVATELGSNEAEETMQSVEDKEQEVPEMPEKIRADPHSEMPKRLSDAELDEIAKKLLNSKLFLAALELHTELTEGGRELSRLRDFFSNPGNFEAQARLDTLLPVREYLNVINTIM